MDIDKKLIWWIFGVSSGGRVRARIIKKLHERPYNASQLAKELGLEYNNARYHLEIMLKNNFIEATEDMPITMYFISEDLEKNFKEVEKILKKLGVE
jgi:predicted ArsR family transcriptional regulator